MARGLHGLRTGAVLPEIRVELGWNLEKPGTRETGLGLREEPTLIKRLSLVGLAFVTFVALMPPAMADRPGFVFPDICCYYNGDVVRTVVPPAAFPNEGRDNFYVVSGQTIFGVVGVAPGAPGYHGGQWKFHLVTWNVDAYPLTSEAAILAAAATGDVTIARNAANDFLCPIQF